MPDHTADRLVDAKSGQLHPRSLPFESDPSKLTVLLVEDNLVNQRILQKALQKRGFTTHTSNHGVEALEFLKSTSLWAGLQSGTDAVKVDVVLMDVHMPVMDGLECTRAIRGFEKEGRILGRVPIIGLTPNARKEFVEMMVEAGMDDFLPVPYRFAELIQKIEKLVAATNGIHRCEEVGNLSHR